MHPPEKEDRLFWQEPAAFEEKKKMPYVTDTSTALFDWVRRRTRRQKASTP